MNSIMCNALNIPGILRVVEAPIDRFQALSPLELGETQVIEEQVVVVFVQVEAGLKHFQMGYCYTSARGNRAILRPKGTSRPPPGT